MKFNFKKIALVVLAVVILSCIMSVSAFAAGTGDVAGGPYMPRPTAPAILLGTLIFSLTCPLYIWTILGM